jgi:hypothetical protein
MLDWSPPPFCLPYLGEFTQVLEERKNQEADESKKLQLTLSFSLVPSKMEKIGGLKKEGRRRRRRAMQKSKKLQLMLSFLCISTPKTRCPKGVRRWKVVSSSLFLRQENGVYLSALVEKSGMGQLLPLPLTTQRMTLTQKAGSVDGVSVWATENSHEFSIEPVSSAQRVWVDKDAGKVVCGKQVSRTRGICLVWFWSDSREIPDITLYPFCFFIVLFRISLVEPRSRNPLVMNLIILFQLFVWLPSYVTRLGLLLPNIAPPLVY